MNQPGRATEAPLAPDDLVLATGTLSVSGATPLPQAIAAAQAGGFHAVSLWASTYHAAVAEGLGPSQQVELLAAGELTVDLMESVIAWAGANDPGAPYAEEESRARVLEAAVALGAPMVSALLLGAPGTTLEEASRAFASIADQAYAMGLRTALEFAPKTVVPDLRSALEVIGGVPGAAVVFDTWHASYGPTVLEKLRGPWGQQVAVIQVSDGPADSPRRLAWASRHQRLLPGQGAKDPSRWVAALRAAGCRAPLTSEVFNDDMSDQLGPVAFGQRQGDALRALGHRGPRGAR